jgi:hypothetical protein
MSSPPAYVEDEESEFRAAVNEFEAIVTDEVAISAFNVQVRLAPGTPSHHSHDEYGAPDGARA